MRFYRSVSSPASQKPFRPALPPSGVRYWLSVLGAKQHNLKNIDVSFPLGALSVVTGVSGSGKSSLVNDVIYNSLAKTLHRALTVPGICSRIVGTEFLNKVIRVDQQPIGQTPTSNPATYTGVFDLIRELFAQLPLSRARGYTQRRFSFNVPGGRCEKCEGAGSLKIEMHFLPDVWIRCEVCGGKRYERQTLEVEYHGHSISDVLEMSCGQALELFSNVPGIRRILQTLCDVGLDYIALGQSATTLSGGEAQRVKLASELSRPDTGRTLYLLDEPTTGLHFEDLQKLLEVLHRLVDLGNSAIVIEHNLDIIKNADWIVDLGPEAGEDGGYLVFQGTPEELRQRYSAPEIVPPAKGTAKKSVKKTAKKSVRKTGKKTEYDAEDNAEDTGNNKPMHHSYTAAALIPILESGPYFERSIYNPFENKPQNKTVVLPEEIAEDEIEKNDKYNNEDDVQSEETEGASSEDLMPWKVLGKKWHFIPRGLVGGNSLQWEYPTLSSLITLLILTGGNVRAVWTNKLLVPIYKGKDDADLKQFRDEDFRRKIPWAVVHTKRVDALYLDLYVKKDSVSQEQIRSIGIDPQINKKRRDIDIVQLKFASAANLSENKLAKLLTEIR
ncbi:MAG: ATP-binding cassette domain-containing protein [Planctomycetaceae bacterium]|nr:ATP-binding cassette domain-containing protein [Planctomycetaceae bacterium]